MIRKAFRVTVIMGMIAAFLFPAGLLPVSARTGKSLAEAKAEAMTTGEKTEFDATRVIVKYKKNSASAQAFSQKNKPRFDKSGLELIPVIAAAADAKHPVKPKKAETPEEINNVRVKLAEYLNNPDVELAEPNYIYRSDAWTITGTTAKPGDYNNTNDWYYSLSKLPELWKTQGCDIGADCGASDSVTVAVIDSGLAYEAYDDSGASSFYDWYGYPGGKNFTGISADHTGGTFSLYTNPGEIAGNGMDDDCNHIIDDANGVDMIAYYWITVLTYFPPHMCDNDIPNDFSGPDNLLFRKAGHPVDTLGHGTFVTGLISGNVDNEASGSGTVSPAFKVTIMPMAANEPFTNLFYSYDVINSINYAAFYGADVMNLSLSGFPYSLAMQEAIDDAYYLDGVTFVAASGNDGTSSIGYPAAFNHVISVGALNSNSARSSYSQYGAGLDLVAYVGEGGGAGTAAFQKTHTCVWTCDETSAFDTVSGQYGIGTSFAAPQVAAAATIALTLKGDLTPLEIANLITGTATDVNSAGYDLETGSGALNLKDMYDYLANTVWSLANPNSNPSADDNNTTDIIAFNKNNYKIDVTPSTGTEFANGGAINGLGFQVWNSNSYYNPANWTILKPADVDGDGTLDIIAFNKNTYKIDVTLSNATSYGKFLGNYQVWNGSSGYNTANWTLLNPADVNGDGKADIIAYNKNTTKIDVTLSTGLSFGGGEGGYDVWNAHSEYNANWTLLDPADVNNDGLADLIAYNKIDNMIDVTPSTGTEFSTGGAVNGGGYVIWNMNCGYNTINWRLLAPADVNNDFRADIIAFNFNTLKIDVTLSTGSEFGTGGATLGGQYNVWNLNSGYNTANWTVLDPSDVNNDGRADIIAINLNPASPNYTKIDVTPSTGTEFGSGGALNGLMYAVWNANSGYNTNWQLLN